MNTIQETHPHFINHTPELILSNIHFTCNKDVDIWNELNTDLKNLKSYCTLKKVSKNHFLLLHSET